MKKEYIMTAALILALVISIMLAFPSYYKWQIEIAENAAKKQVELSQQIIIKEAENKVRAERSLAQLEIEKAQASEKANKILSQSMQSFVSMCEQVVKEKPVKRMKRKRYTQDEE